jgi:hypothetical protein
MDPLDLGVLDFCKAIGLAEAEITDDELHLVVEDHLVTLALDRVRGSVVMFAAAGEVGPSAASLRRVLELNHLGQSTDGFSLGLEPDGDLVVLSHRLDAEALRTGRLHSDFDRFVAILERYRAGFDEAPEPEAGAGQAPSQDWIRI